MEELLTSRPGEHSSLPSSAAAENPGDRGVNFAMFLTMMSEHLFEFDAEAELVEAFSSFDESDSGTVRCDEIRKWLSETGDRMSQSEVRVRSSLLQGPIFDRLLNRSIGF
jgi:myosin regulatory light chain 12